MKEKEVNKHASSKNAVLAKFINKTMHHKFNIMRIKKHPIDFYGCFLVSIYYTYIVY